MQTFWQLSSNKIQLQQFFQSYVKTTYNGNTPIILGGCLTGDNHGCMIVYKTANDSNAYMHTEPLANLSCSHEEADVRIIYHIQQCITGVKNKVVVATEDTDVVVSLMYHYLT